MGGKTHLGFKLVYEKGIWRSGGRYERVGTGRGSLTECPESKSKLGQVRKEPPVGRLRQGTSGLWIGLSWKQSPVAKPRITLPKGFVVAAAEGPRRSNCSKRGTEFCEFCRRPSKEANRKVLSFWMGKPMAPPYCWRLSEFLIG